MPSPIAHATAGYVIFQILKDRLPERWRTLRQGGWLVLGAVICLALLPDLDAIPGVLSGNLKRYHNNLTHSVLLALPVGLAVAALARRFRIGSARWWFAAAFLGYALHVGMDYLTWGRGVMAFWPLTAARFRPAAFAFAGLGWNDPLSSSRHWLTLQNEFAFTLVTLLLTVLATRLRRRCAPGR